MTMKKVLLCICILLYGGLLIALDVEHGAAKGERPEGLVYIVEPGDTLWSIAERHREQAGVRDVRELVYALRQFNDLDSTHLKPGQRLIVPMAW
jgi:Tfp pilus assembly protein FimV